MSIGRDSLAYWGSQAANFVFSFVASVLVSRTLGPERRGLFTGVLLANMMLVNLTNLGLQTMAMYFTGKDTGKLARFHTLVLVLVAVISVGDLLLILLGGEALRQRVFAEISWGYLALALAALPFSLYYFAAQGVMTGLGRVGELSRFLFWYTLVMNGANVAVLLLPWPVDALLVVWFVGQAGPAAYLYLLIRKTPCRWEWPSGREAIVEIGGMLSYGLRAFVGNFASSYVNRNDQLNISEKLNNTGLGVYSLSVRLAEFVLYPSAALENAGYHRMVRSEPKEAARLAVDLFRTNFLINGVTVLGLILTADWFVPLLYRKEFEGAVAPLRILLPGALLFSCSRMLALYFSAQLGKPQIPSAIAWLTLAINFPAMRWFIFHKDGSFVSAAWVTTGSYAFMLLIYLILFSARTGLVNPAHYVLPQKRDWERLRRLMLHVRTIM